MENQVKVFESAEFGSVRTVDIEGVVYFVGRDVATILAYKDTVDALRKHVDEEDKAKRPIPTNSGTQEMVVINESGVYSLVFRSKLPNAKKFKRWVTSEVLPSIRKTGSYSMQVSEKDLLALKVLNATNSTQRLTALSEYTEYIKEPLIKTIEQQSSIISEQQPKVEYHDNVIHKRDLITTSAIAKDLGITAVRLNKILHDNGVIFKQGSVWFPYADHQWLITDGYADYHIYEDKNVPQVLKWTEKGRKWIIETFFK